MTKLASAKSESPLSLKRHRALDVAVSHAVPNGPGGAVTIYGRDVILRRPVRQVRRGGPTASDSDGGPVASVIGQTARLALSRRPRRPMESASAIGSSGTPSSTTEATAGRGKRLRDRLRRRA
ncbi:hypothetical protein V5799_012096 [Amblyomma americanum]|uniref:Uncharacterized protein n=1 Tax=Amblyomma americanum TaxID=6943 RepID=A0AAQ4EFE6_AMBAM